MTNKEALKWLEETVEWYEKEYPFCNPNNEQVEVYKVAIKALEERPQGEWIKYIRCIECSVCKNKFFADDDENCQDYEPCTDLRFNFCPNCGADMRKEAEND